jgi:hypothetical protein
VGSDAWAATGSAWAGDLRVVVEDLPLEALQLLARLDPDLVERRAQAAVHVERLALPPRAVEREHELRPQALAMRMRGDQRLQLAGHLGVTSELEVGVDSDLECGEA